MKQNQKILKYFLLLASGGLLLPAIASAEDSRCDSASKVDRNFSQSYIKQQCEPSLPGAPIQACENVYKEINKMAKKYIETAKQVCGKKQPDPKQATGNVQEQKEYYSEQKKMLNGYQDQVDSLVKLADGYLEKNLPSVSKSAVKELKQIQEASAVAAEADKLFSSDDYEKKFKSDSFEKTYANRVTDKSAKNLASALHESSRFIRDLIDDKEKQSGLSKTLQQQKDWLTKAEDKLGPGDPQPSASPVAESKGPFDMATLAALAGPAAGLASAMMQKKTDSGISETPTPTPPGSTDSANGPTQPTNPAGTSLDPKKSGPLAASKMDEPKKPATDLKFAETVGESFGSALDSGFSGISSGSPAAAAGSGSSAGAGVSSSGSSGSSSGGGTGGGGEADSGKSRKPAAAAAAATEDALQSFGGGGGGLNFEGGAATSSATSTADEPMAEMLTDMESTIDAEMNGAFGSGEEQQGSDIGSQDSESLFPRVSACYARALKRGNLLNNIGESVVDE